MNRFALIFYQSLILSVFYRLGQCQRMQYNLVAESVHVENTVKEWKFLMLSKISNSEQFTFNNYQLNKICDGTFSSSNVEIVEVFDRTMRFSLIREKNDQVFIKLTFSMDCYLQRFFRDIRSRQEQGCGAKLSVGKLLQYQIDTNRNEDPLKLLTTPVEVYHKDLDAKWFPGIKSVNFVYHDSDTGTDRVHLVLLAKTFNISEKLRCTNKFILCSANIPTHRFILHIPQNTHAKNFYEFIKDDRNDQIPCPNEWVTRKLSRTINSR